MSNARRLVIHGELPAHNTPAERIAKADADVRELSARMRQKLTEKSAEFSNTGYVLDEESWEMAVNGRILVLTVILRRPA